MITTALRSLLVLLSLFVLAIVPGCSQSGSGAKGQPSGGAHAGSTGAGGSGGSTGGAGSSATAGSSGANGGKSGTTDAGVPDRSGATGGASPAGGAGGMSSVGGTGGTGGMSSVGGTGGAGGSTGGTTGDAGRDVVDAEPDGPKLSPWVATWATAPMTITSDANPPSPGLAGNTLRQVVHASMGGKQIRIRLDNSLGDGPVTITAVHVAISKGGSDIDTSTDRSVAFSGSSSLTLQAGDVQFSDPVSFTLPPLTSVAVSMLFGKVPGKLSGHSATMATSYLQSGNVLSAASLSSAASTVHWYYLTGLVVMADESSGSVVCIGDSTTEGDGWGNPVDGNARWTDYLAKRLQANKATSNVGALNEGIGSNTVLASSWSDSAGLPLEKRFPVDALAQSGVRWVIIIEGVNDIGNCPPGKGQTLAANIISAYKNFIAAAHAKGIRIFGGTIMPFGAASGYGQNNGQLVQDHIDAWKTVNDWIRTSGAFDAVIDFAKAVVDPQRPEYMAGKYVTFDGCHPSSAGYEQMANTVDLTLFSN
jgi:lysophospholipase L1-like esterase